MRSGGLSDVAQVHVPIIGVVFLVAKMALADLVVL